MFLQMSVTPNSGFRLIINMGHRTISKKIAIKNFRENNDNWNL